MPAHLGPHRQLFLDDFLVERADKVARRVIPVQKHDANPVIRPAEPWEPPGYIAYGSIIYDEQEKLYKAWCMGTGPAQHSPDAPPISGGVYHFHSDDGLAWRRAESDALPVGSRKRSHLVALTLHSDHPAAWTTCYEPFGVFKDAAEPDPARRYKMGYLYLRKPYTGPGEDPFHPGQRRGLGVAFSPDGYRWTRHGDEPVTQATSDGATHWFFDTARKRYVMHGRTRHFDPAMKAKYADDPLYRHNAGRAVRRSESDDFLRWEPDTGEFVLAADEHDGPADDIYGMSVFAYEGLYLGLVQVFHNEPGGNWLDIQLAVSRDSKVWQRLSDRTPIIPVGGVGEWDRFNNSLANSPPVVRAGGDELWIYYAGRNARHGGAYKGPDNGRTAGAWPWAGIGVGVVPRDRFAAMEATFDAGTLLTKPVTFTGRELRVNAAAKFGHIGVTLRDAEGNALEQAAGEVRGQDGLDLRVPLPDLAAAAGKPVRIEFTISNARLFSFWFA